MPEKSVHFYDQQTIINKARVKSRMTFLNTIHIEHEKNNPGQSFATVIDNKTYV